MEPENRFFINLYRFYAHMRFFDRDFEYYFRDCADGAQLKRRIINDINRTLEDKRINAGILLIDGMYDDIMSWVNQVFAKNGVQIEVAIFDAQNRPQPTKFKIFRASDYEDYV